MSFVNCAGKLLDVSSPQIMGVINITPNSFSSVGRFQSPEQALVYAEKIIAEGATVLDVGGEPTNPGVHPITSLQQELDRVIPVVELLTQQLAVPISVDTSKPEVMREAIAAGASIINDVRALSDPEALKVVAASDVAVCLMHMSYPQGGRPAVPVNSDVLGDDLLQRVKAFLQERMDICLAAGITHDRIMIDPGIGHGNFGKNLQQNLVLLKQLSAFKGLGRPILIGVSRKTFIGELLNLPVEDRLYGSLGAAVMAVLNGANIVRVHDVRATVEALRVVMAISNTHVAPDPEAEQRLGGANEYVAN